MPSLPSFLSNLFLNPPPCRVCRLKNQTFFYESPFFTPFSAEFAEFQSEMYLLHIRDEVQKKRLLEKVWETPLQTRQTRHPHFYEKYPLNPC